jgi:hypothetical protein
MTFSIFLAGLLATAVVALSGRNDPAEDMLPTTMPALTEETVCPGIFKVNEKTTSIGKSRFIDCLINYCIEGAALLNLTLYSKAGQNINQNIYTVFVNSTLAVVGCWMVS